MSCCSKINLSWPINWLPFWLIFIQLVGPWEFSLHQRCIFPCPRRDEKHRPISSFILREPCIIGLHKSRPASEHWQTEGPAMDRRFMNYLRPKYLQHKRFSILDDYYSLGLMLLEIGLWYPEQGWSQQKEYKALPPEKLRELYLKRCVPRLGPRMGSVYRDIVELCLNNGLDDKSPTVKTSEEKSQRIFPAFIHSVVYQLSELVRSAAPSKLGLLDSKNMASSSIFDWFADAKFPLYFSGWHNCVPFPH